MATMAIGSTTRARWTRRERARQRRKSRLYPARSASRVVIQGPSGVGEDVDVFPAGQVEGGAVGKILEGGLGQLHAAFADQHGVQALAQGMQVQHVRRR